MNRRELLISRLRTLEAEYATVEALPFYSDQQCKLDYIARQYEDVLRAADEMENENG